MSQPTTLAQMQTSAVAKPKSNAPMSFLTSEGFDQLLRVSNMLSSSTMVPVAYRKWKEIKQYGEVTGYEENTAAIANCAVALNMAQRMGADPLMIMQNLHIIEGRPSWSSPFIIASINSCGRYSSLRFELSKPGEPTEISYTATEWVKPAGGGKARPNEITKKITVRHQTCVAWAIERETGERLESPVVSIQMALDEGWLTKKGSKWQTIPELMLRYRCASFFGRLYAPELLMGLQTTEEVMDFIDAAPDGTGSFAVNLADLQDQAAPPLPDSDVETVVLETDEVQESEVAGKNAENGNGASKTGKSSTGKAQKPADSVKETDQNVQEAPEPDQVSDPEPDVEEDAQPGDTSNLQFE